MNSTLCTISMRGGSQGVKNKNFKLINGKPLMYFTIKQAIKSRIFDHIVVSTDSKKILRIAKSYGADGWFLRPKKLSLNSSQKIPVIRHALLQSEKFRNTAMDVVHTMFGIPSEPLTKIFGTPPDTGVTFEVQKIYKQTPGPEAGQELNFG